MARFSKLLKLFYKSQLSCENLRTKEIEAHLCEKEYLLSDFQIPVKLPSVLYVEWLGGNSATLSQGTQGLKEGVLMKIITTDKFSDFENSKG